MKPDKKLQLNCHNEAGFHIGSKCSRDCSTLVNLFSLGAVEVSPHLKFLLSLDAVEVSPQLKFLLKYFSLVKVKFFSDTLSNQILIDLGI